MVYIADKPYDDVRLAKAVGACIHAVLDDRFPEYGKTVSCITCIRHQYMQTITGIPAQKKHTYQFDFKFTRRQECDFDNPKEFVKPNSPEFTNMFLTFSPDGSLTCETHSDTGKMFEAELDKEVEKTVMWRYQGYSEPPISTGFKPIDFKKNIESLSGGKYKFAGFVPTEIAKAIEDGEITVPEVKYALNDIPVATRIEKLSRRNERIKSTLTAIVEAATREILQEAPPSVREYINNIARIELDDISIKTDDNKLTVAAKYVFIKKYGTAEIANISIRFKDEFLTVDGIWIFTEPYALPYDFERCFPHMLISYITRCIERDFCRMVNAWGASEWLDGCPCKYCKEEKEKDEMTTSEANYIYNIKMTSEMREACDKIAEDAKQQAYRKASYENYKLKVRLNAAYGTAALAVGAENKKLAVKEIVINEPAMVVFWEDGTKTVVTARDEAFDAEKGLAMAFAKKALGNNYAAGGRFKAKLKHAKWAPKKQEKKKDIFCEENLREDAKEVLDPVPKAEKKKTTKKKK